MPEEDKLIHRFQRERQRQLKAAKKSGFSLEDGDSGGGSLGAPTELTHGGVALDIDNLSDGDFGDSEDDMPKHQRRKDDRGFEGADFVKRAHFGNDSDGEDGERKLSQKELLEETIAKYKQQKFERQDARREENNKIDEIDAEFDAIRGLIFQAGSKAEAKKKDPGTKSALALSRGEVDGHADFERLAAELSREVKAQPTDRLQSEMELATAEAKRLKLLEADRLRRMQPDGGGNGGGGGGDGGSGGGSSTRRAAPTDDDLVDDFGLPGTGEPDYDSDDDDDEEGGIDDEEDDEEDEEDDEDDEGDEGDEEELGSAIESGEEGEEGGSDDDEGEDDEDDEDEDEGEGEEVVVRSAKAAKAAKAAKGAAAGSARKASARTPQEKPLVELPYVFTCPSDSAALGKLIDLAGPVVARQRTVLQRLIAGHHVKLKEANKEKLAKLAELLIERVGSLAATEPPDAAALAAAAAAAAPSDGSAPPEFATPCALLQPLYPAIYSLAEQLPVPVALRMLDELQAVRSGWRQARKVLGGPGGSRHVSLPPPALAVLALLVQLYPLSDFRHVVVTPLVLLVQEVLAQPTPLPSSRVGVRRLLFLCSIALHLVGAAARWMPELHQVATALLEALMARGVEGGAKAGAAPQPLRFDGLHGDDDDEENGDEGGDGDEDDGKGPMDVDTAAAILRLVTDLARVGAPLPSYPELFGPMLATLTSPPAAASKRASEAQAGGKPAKGGKKQAKQATPAADAASALPAGLRSLHKEAVGAVSDGLRAAIRTRKPLSMQKALAVPLKQFNPIFDDDFQPDQSMDPDRARAEKQKLQRKVKQEKKGAIRELRKDGQFLAAERQKEKEKQTAMRKRRRPATCP